MVQFFISCGRYIKDLPKGLYILIADRRNHRTKTSMENEYIEPLADLGLALGYSGYRVVRRTSNDLGAGANAASRIVMNFVATPTGPLSEIVWSPQKGLCLKCTECNFSENKHSLLRAVGPNDMVQSPQKINTSTRSSIEKPIDQQIIHTPSSTFPDLNTKVSDMDNSHRSAGDNDNVLFCHEPHTETSAFVNLVEKNDPGDSENNQVAEIAKPILNNIPSSPDVARTESLFNDPANEVRDVGNQTLLSRTEVVLASEEKKLTSPAKNDLQGLGDGGFVAKGNISGSRSAFEAEKNSEHHEGIPSEKVSAGKHSPTNSGIRRCKRKGKEKALSDGDAKGMMSKAEDEDSDESVESCNSAALFSTGKKRRGFEQRLIVGSKRVKQDSPFMNWISNMMKGFLKAKDETPSLTLTAANTIKSHESAIQNLDASNKNQDPGRGNNGFQSIFLTKVQGKSQTENDQAGLDPTNKVCDINATPISCHGENFNFLNVFNERFKNSTCGDMVGLPTRSKISSVTLSPSKRSSEGNIAQNTSSSDLPVDVGKERASTSSSLGKRKMNVENIDLDPPSEVKKVHNIGYKSNLPGSLWITRFTPKSSSPSLNRDTAGAVECLSDCMKHTPSCQNNVNVCNNIKTVGTRQQGLEEQLTSSGKELLSATETEASISIGLHCPRSKDSETMTPLFSRRLDALKHIVPSGVFDNQTSSTVTCFFCGRKGHHLEYCPEITDNEIEHLRNMKSSNSFEELPCMCVRCFELDHRAAACPTASKDQHLSVCRASSSSFSELQCYARFEENTKLLYKNREAIAGQTVWIDTGKGPRTLYEVIADKMKSNTNVKKKYVGSSSKEIKPWDKFTNQQDTDTTKVIFDAVRMLRLSRTDILKWKNSRTSVPHLGGFFLRLRLTKWEQGLGGTGYYVACITGGNKQGTQRDSIAVNVGGIECSVESQYISNHDFLEDELTAWLRATKKSGGKIPSEEELTVRVKERRMLRF
ncbi:hypothetical protein V6N12_033436 [Hibiscus sabdariffa]|uniref:CCHC-type domain-containing protein n=1 Tax=Hibiscus sabdariffa TaxID=183260 RepID=A0ABR2BVM1_9ROSI